VRVGADGLRAHRRQGHPSLLPTRSTCGCGPTDGRSAPAAQVGGNNDFNFDGFPSALRRLASMGAADLPAASAMMLIGVGTKPMMIMGRHLSGRAAAHHRQHLAVRRHHGHHHQRPAAPAWQVLRRVDSSSSRSRAALRSRSAPVRLLPSRRPIIPAAGGPDRPQGAITGRAPRDALRPTRTPCVHGLARYRAAAELFLLHPNRLTGSPFSPTLPSCRSAMVRLLRPQVCLPADRIDLIKVGSGAVADRSNLCGGGHHRGGVPTLPTLRRRTTKAGCWLC